MNSGNHVMLVGDLYIWMNRYLAGIRNDPARPGYKHIVIRPVFAGDLKFVRAWRDSPYGRIVSNWQRDGGTLTMDVTIPGNTTAETVAGIILDEAAIGITNRKTTGVRVIPVPGAKLGEYVDFGGLFGSGVVTQSASPQGAEAFVNRGGHIPAPIHSLMN